MPCLSPWSLLIQQGPKEPLVVAQWSHWRRRRMWRRAASQTCRRASWLVLMWASLENNLIHPGRHKPRQKWKCYQPRSRKAFVRAPSSRKVQESWALAQISSTARSIRLSLSLRASINLWPSSPDCLEQATSTAATSSSTARPTICNLCIWTNWQGYQARLSTWTSSPIIHQTPSWDL